MGAGFVRFRACDFYRLGEDLAQAPAPFIEHQRTSSRALIPKFDDRRPSSQLHKSMHIRGPSPEHPYHFLNIRGSYPRHPHHSLSIRGPSPSTHAISWSSEDHQNSIAGEVILRIENRRTIETVFLCGFLHIPFF